MSLDCPLEIRFGRGSRSKVEQELDVKGRHLETPGLRDFPDHVGENFPVRTPLRRADARMSASPPLRHGVSGLILAGGQARRLGGVDKGLIQRLGRPLVEWCIDALVPQVETKIGRAHV